MSSKISERVRADVGLAAADIQTAKTGPWYSVAQARRLRAVLVTGAPATGKTATLELLQATDASGTGSKALGDPVVSAAAGAGATSIKLEAEAQAIDLDAANGFGFVAVKASSNNGAALSAAAVIEFGDQRYGG